MFLFQSYKECKVGSEVPLGLEENVSAKLLNDLLRNMEAQTDSISVKLFRFINKSKKLEQLLLIFIFYTDPRVFNLHLYHSIRRFTNHLDQLTLVLIFKVISENWLLKGCENFFQGLDKFASYIDSVAAQSKLERIGNQIQKDLLDSLLVWAYHEVFVWEII